MWSKGTIKYGQTNNKMADLMEWSVATLKCYGKRKKKKKKKGIWWSKQKITKSKLFFKRWI